MHREEGKERMTIQECYDIIGGDYEDVFERLCKEERIKKYMFKFLNDPSFEMLCTSLNEENLEGAFCAAHTLKGICQNLGFGNLYESSDRLAEKLRTRKKQNVTEFMRQVEEDYGMTVSVIKQFKAQNTI